MFNSLTGTITGKYPQHLFIDTNGIEWDVIVSDNTLDSLPPVGEKGRVYVWMQHTDQLMNLYGFASLNDRNLFFDLLKVDGIGPKGAIKILGNIDAGRFAKILEEGDLEALQKVPGVGKKTAGKVLLQLKGKLTLEENSSPARAVVHPYSDVVDALVSMGYDKKQVEQVVTAIGTELSQNSEFEAMEKSAKEDSIFRRAVVELAR